MSRIGLIAFFAAASLASSAMAQSMEIGPTRVQMYGAERSATVTIRNGNTEPLTVQVRAMDWTHDTGQDAYAPSDVLLASPPQATLAPGESQVIRVVAEDAPSMLTEQAFRLVVDQIPEDEGQGDVGVRTVIRALVPVFITPSIHDRPRLEWTARRTGEGVMLTARNTGAARDRLVAATVSAAGEPIGDPIEGYVLSGAARSWTIGNVSSAVRAMRIAGEGEFGPIVADVAIAP